MRLQQADSQHLHISGPAACGKTTLLKTLVAQAAARGMRAVYLEASPEPILYRLVRAVAETEVAKQRVLLKAYHQGFPEAWLEVVHQLSKDHGCLLAIDDDRFDPGGLEMTQNGFLVTASRSPHCEGFALDPDSLAYQEHLEKWLATRLSERARKLLQERCGGTFGAASVYLACLRSALYLDAADLPQHNQFISDFTRRLEARLSPESVELLAKIAVARIPLPRRIFRQSSEARILDAPEMTCLLQVSEGPPFQPGGGTPELYYSCPGWLAEALLGWRDWSPAHLDLCLPLSSPEKSEDEASRVYSLGHGLWHARCAHLELPEQVVTKLGHDCVGAAAAWPRPMKVTLLSQALEVMQRSPCQELRIKCAAVCVRAEWPLESIEALVSLTSPESLLLRCRAVYRLGDLPETVLLTREALNGFLASPSPHLGFVTELFCLRFAALGSLEHSLAPAVGELSLFVQPYLADPDQEKARALLSKLAAWLNAYAVQVKRWAARCAPHEFEDLPQLLTEAADLVDPESRVAALALAARLLNRQGQHRQAVETIARSCENLGPEQEPYAWILLQSQAVSLALDGQWEASFELNKRVAARRRLPNAWLLNREPVAGIPAGPLTGVILKLASTWRGDGWYSASARLVKAGIFQFRKVAQDGPLGVALTDLVRERSISLLALGRHSEAFNCYQCACLMAEKLPEQDRLGVVFRLAVHQARLLYVQGDYTGVLEVLANAQSMRPVEDEVAVWLIRELSVLSALQLGYDSWSEVDEAERQGQSSPFWAHRFRIRAGLIGLAQGRPEAQTWLREALVFLSTWQVGKGPVQGWRGEARMALAPFSQEPHACWQAAEEFRQAMLQEHGHWQAHWLRAIRLWLDSLPERLWPPACERVRQAQATLVAAFVKADKSEILRRERVVWNEWLAGQGSKAQLLGYGAASRG